MAGVMETDQFAQQYATETDDQLVQLAAEKEQLTPEARLQLVRELEKRGVDPSTFDRKHSAAEAVLGRNNLTRRDWQQFRRTGEWPILSGFAFVGQWIVLLGGVMALVIFGANRFPKVQFTVVVGLWVVVAGVLSDRIKRAIRFKELRSYRERRGCTR